MIDSVLWLSALCLCCFLNNQVIADCGYNACTKSKDGFINVHMVPHTHDDVGWLKTIDQLYYGNKGYIQKASVQYIIESAVSSLIRDPRRRFIYVETSFFWKWWLKQNEYSRNQVKQLVNEGRLEFTGGGWAMHDEGATHYQSMLDQMSWGFRRLKDTFGDCGRPRAGWQIDPFGHSKESASMMARFGFDGLLFARLDEQEKQQRFTNLTADMIWETSTNLGDKADLFTGILYDMYSEPRNFCYDMYCGEDPIIDDRESPEFNADEKANLFVQYVERMAPNYKTSNLLITMGMDFHFQAAHQNFMNIDRLIDAVNELQANGSKINVFYSTPACYIKAINDRGLEFTTKNDDFFPYGSSEHKYWTGYFTSRPTLKFFERKGNNFLQVCKQLFTLGNIDSTGNDVAKLDKLREAMGIMQHHDAVTGTEKQAVAYDYARQLNMGFTSCETLADASLRKLMSKNASATVNVVSSTSDMLLKSCMLLNISACDITEANSNFVVTLYNPLSRTVTKNVRLPVSGNGKNVVVYDPSGTVQTVQIVPIPEPVQKIPGRTSLAKVEVVFVAKDLPPLGYRSYYVVNNNTSNTDDVEDKVNAAMRILKPDGILRAFLQEVLFMDHFKNTATSILSKFGIKFGSGSPGDDIFVNNSGDVEVNNVKVEQSFWWYKSYPYNSGAYVFRPLGEAKVINTSPDTLTYTGPVVEEKHQTFTNWVSQVIRKYVGSNVVEYNWLIGPIPVNDNSGKEIISRYTVKSIKSDKTFYTDSNGREMVERVRDKRSSFKLDLQEPVAGNYYPVNTRITIKDSKTQFSVITDRSEGGSSLSEGEIELMLHRRCLSDDGWGVGEALNENAFGQGLVARGTHYVTSGSPSSQSATDRFVVQEQILSAWMFFTPTTKTIDEWRAKYNMEYTGLKSALPSNVQITTLEPWSDSTYLIRLEHIMEKTDDSEMAKSVIVNLANIFAPFTITSIEESTLGGNQALKDMKRLEWKKGSKTSEKSNNSSENTVNINSPSVELTGMEIKSFIVKINYK